MLRRVGVEYSNGPSPPLPCICCPYFDAQHQRYISISGDLIACCAGRDGAASRCILFWNQSDFATLSNIKNPAALSAQGRQNFEAGMAAVRSYTCKMSCRHAQLVNFFQPAALPDLGPCAGGCDNCDRRLRGDISERDFASEARLLLSSCKALGGFFGLGKAISLLRSVHSVVTSSSAADSDHRSKQTIENAVLRIWIRAEDTVSWISGTRWHSFC